MMELICHSGCHSTYNKDVRRVINDLKKKFRKARDPEKKDHGAFKKKNMQTIRDWLIQWSKDELASIFIEGREDPGKTQNKVSVFNNVRDG